MSLGFGATFVNPRHWSDPFICHCENHQHDGDHSLGLGQKIAAIAIAVLTAAPLLLFPPVLGIPSFFAVGALVFYTTCALFKARNVVWLDYRAANPGVSWNFYSPIYWGVRGFGVPSRTHVGFDPYRGRGHFGGSGIPARDIGGRVPVGAARTHVHVGDTRGHVPVGGRRTFNDHSGISFSSRSSGSSSRSSDVGASRGYFDSTRTSVGSRNR